MKPHLTVFAPAVIVASLWQQPLRAEEALAARPTDGARDRTAETPETPALSLLAMGTDLIGLEVRNYQDARLGRVQDLVIDVSAGRVLGLLLNLGGVLGVGSNDAIVPLALFRYDSVRRVLQLNSTLETLKGAPRLELTRLRPTQQSEAIAEVYRYFRAAPNHGERPSRPSSIPRSESEVRVDAAELGELDEETTARIRREVMAQADLSAAAKNIKIITVNGRVTLRGAVPNDHERQAVVQLAHAAASGPVDDQLRVQP